MRTRVGIIGAGVVGTAVGMALAAKGFEITGVFDIKPESTQMLTARTGAQPCPAPHSVAQQAQILFLTVNDSAIGTVVRQLSESKAFFKDQMVVHMSGAQSSEVLDEARDWGACGVSIHPLQAFASPEQAIVNMKGSIFSVEGDSRVHDDARRIVENLGGEYFFIERQAKTLYHAGACAVSNYLVTIVDFGVRLLESSGIPREMAVRALLPLIQGTVKNLENVGLPMALTGPVSRGDVQTIARHLDSLEGQSPEQIHLYSLLGLHTSRLALEKGSIDAESAAELQALFSGSMNPMAAAS